MCIKKNIISIKKKILLGSKNIGVRRKEGGKGRRRKERGKEGRNLEGRKEGSTVNVANEFADPIVSNRYLLSLPLTLT